MKANFQKLTNTSHKNSFVDFSIKTSRFDFHWHYHPEIEICYIKKGVGSRIVGDSVQNFSDGDLVLVGSNLPHCWITNENFNKSDDNVEVYVIQFKQELLINNSLIEFNGIKKLLESAKKGIKFKVLNDNHLKQALLKIEFANGFEKYLNLLYLLHLMCHTEEKQLLVSELYYPEYSEKAEQRIINVCNYIHENYRESIQIRTLAEVAAMNPTSFCRFFKKNIGKTAIEYINDLRITYVRNQIPNTDIPIYKIAFDAGFYSITHFNKIFKRHFKKTPMQYKNTVN